MPAPAVALDTGLRECAALLWHDFAGRQAAAGAVERAARYREAEKVGDRVVGGPGAAIRCEARLEAGGGDYDAASTRGRNGR